MSLSRYASERAERATRYFAIALVAIIVFGVCWLGIRTFLMRTAASEISRNAQAQQAMLVQARSDLLRSESMRAPSEPLGMRAPGLFQRYLEERAAAQETRVSEFRVSPELLPYLSAFSGEMEQGSDWGQIGVSFGVQGRFEKVYETLRSLLDSPVPIELDSVELHSQPQGGVNAVVTLRVLSRQPGASS